MAKKDFIEWEPYYRDSNVKNMPWYCKNLDKDLRREVKIIKKGKFLDLGTGAGTQAIALSKLGFKVMGTDISKSAIKKAKKLSKKVKFKQDNILKTKIKDKFNYIFDRGCLHVFDPKYWNSYVKNIKKVLEKDGVLFLKTFSIKEKKGPGPYRFSKNDIRRIFKKDFEIKSFKETTFQSTFKKDPKALFIILRKK